LMESTRLAADERRADRRQADRRQTLVVLGLGLGLRLLVLWDVLAKFPVGWVFTRGQEMGLLAKSIVEGHGLGSPFGPSTGPTAFIAPGYPLLIAGVFKLLGTYSLASAVVIILGQIALNLLTIWLILWVARRIFDRRVAWVAGLVWACSLPVIWIPTIFWDTSIAICLLVGLIALVVRFQGRMTPGVWVGLGAYCAVTALINPAMLLVLLAWLGWLAAQQRPVPWVGLGLAVATLCVVFSPWPIRNAKVFHAFIPLRTTVGFELWMGNRPGATGFLDESLFPSFNARELEEYKSMGELGYTAHKSELARSYIAAEPVTFLRLTAVRVVRYWLGTGAEKGSVLFAIHACLTSAFGLYGLYLLFWGRRISLGILFALPLLLFPLPYYITHAEFRYRLALDPLLTLLAGYGVVALFGGKRVVGVGESETAGG
jgi:hypothetical protein